MRTREKRRSSPRKRRGRGRRGEEVEVEKKRLSAFVFFFFHFHTFSPCSTTLFLAPHAVQLVRGAGLGGCRGVPVDHGCAAGRSRRLPAARRRRRRRGRSDRTSIGIFGSPTTPLASGLDARRGQQRRRGTSSKKRPSRCLLAELPLRLGVRGGHRGAWRQREPPA